MMNMGRAVLQTLEFSQELTLVLAGRVSFGAAAEG
jgi:hypothetical protein